MPASGQLGESVILGVLLIVGAVSCRSADAKACLDQFESAQQLVLKVEAQSLESVQASLNAVEQALQACKTAKRSGEVDELVKARNQLSAHAEVLGRRAKRKSKKAPTPEEMARLVREGDPSCPRGQAYKLEASPKEVRCTGAQLIERSRAEVKSYFEDRNYRVREPSPTELEIEHGAERYSFKYSSPTAESPSCVVLVPPPGLPWQEAMARASGANPGRLKPSGTVKSRGGMVPYEVDEQQVIVRIGQCPTAS